MNPIVSHQSNLDPHDKSSQKSYLNQLIEKNQQLEFQIDELRKYLQEQKIDQENQKQYYQNCNDQIYLERDQLRGERNQLKDENVKLKGQLQQALKKVEELIDPQNNKEMINLKTEFQIINKNYDEQLIKNRQLEDRLQRIQVLKEQDQQMLQETFNIKDELELIIEQQQKKITELTQTNGQLSQQIQRQKVKITAIQEEEEEDTQEMMNQKYFDILERMEKKEQNEQKEMGQLKQVDVLSSKEVLNSIESSQNQMDQLKGSIHIVKKKFKGSKDKESMVRNRELKDIELKDSMQIGEKVKSVKGIRKDKITFNITSNPQQHYEVIKEQSSSQLMQPLNSMIIEQSNHITTKKSDHNHHNDNSNNDNSNNNGSNHNNNNNNDNDNDNDNMKNDDFDQKIKELLIQQKEREKECKVRMDDGVSEFEVQMERSKEVHVCEVVKMEKQEVGVDWKKIKKKKKMNQQFIIQQRNDTPIRQQEREEEEILSQRMLQSGTEQQQSREQTTNRKRHTGFDMVQGSQINSTNENNTSFMKSENCQIY